MGHAGLRGRDGRDLSWIKMNAMTENCADAGLFGGLEPDLATVLINCRVGHHGGRAIAHQFVKKPWRFRSRFRSSKLALDWEDMLPQPRKQLAFPARDDRVLRQMRVAIDQSGKNCHSSSVEPTN